MILNGAPRFKRSAKAPAEARNKIQSINCVC
jgi:hypothetical protein